MKLSIDGVITYLERLPYTEGAHILQIELTTSVEVEGLHRRLVETLKRWQGGDGVMDIERFQPHENRPGASEIRVINGLELEFIDICRLLGYGVEQMYDDLPDATSSN